MAGKILGIDIQSDSITAVQIEARLRGYHVVGCASVMMRDFDKLDESLKALREQMDFKADTYISTIPGEQALYRNITMPFQSTKKIRQTIAYEIEPMIPFPVEDLIVDFTLINKSERTDILTASVSKEYISKYLTTLHNNEINPDVLDISGVPVVLWLFKQQEIPDDGVLFQISQKRTTMVLFIKRHICLIKSFIFCGALIPEAISNLQTHSNVHNQTPETTVPLFESFCKNVRNIFHAFEYQNNIRVSPEKVFITGTGNIYPYTTELFERLLDIPVEKIDITGNDPSIHVDEKIAQSWNPETMNSALALALRGNKKAMGFNFRKDEFEPKRTNLKLKREIQRTSVLLIVIFAFVTTYFCIDYYFLKEHYRMLDKKINEIFKQTLPGVSRIVNPVQQMRVEINAIKKSTFSNPGIGEGFKVIDLLRDISVRIPESLDVKVVSMIIDSGTVVLKGETDTFNTVDIIKKRLEPSECFRAVNISSANLDRSRKRVQFEIKLKRVK